MNGCCANIRVGGAMEQPAHLRPINSGVKEQVYGADFYIVFAGAFMTSCDGSIFCRKCSA